MSDFMIGPLDEDQEEPEPKLAASVGGWTRVAAGSDDPSRVTVERRTWLVRLVDKEREYHEVGGQHVMIDDQTGWVRVRLNPTEEVQYPPWRVASIRERVQLWERERRTNDEIPF